MRTVRAILLTASVGLCGLAPALSPSLAHAQGAAVPGKEYAKKLFDEGVDLEKKSDFTGALAKYKEASQITQTPGLRFHTGYCLEMTGKLSAALEEYDAADKLARDQNRPEVHVAVTTRLDPLRVRVPQLAIRLATHAKDAEVQLDGVVVGAPLLDGKAFRTDPGEHTITARAPGYKAFTRKVQVPENVTTSIDVSLERTTPVAPVVAPPAPIPAQTAPAPAPAPAAPAAAPPTATVEPPHESSHRSVALPIITTAGAVVLAGVGVGLFLASGSAQSDAQSTCPSQVSCAGEQSNVRTLDTLALGSFIGAAGLGVVAIVLWTSKGPEHTAGSARVVARPGSLGLVGRF